MIQKVETGNCCYVPLPCAGNRTHLIDVVETLRRVKRALKLVSMYHNACYTLRPIPWL